jgi:5-methylthioribose kinase
MKVYIIVNSKGEIVKSNQNKKVFHDIRGVKNSMLTNIRTNNFNYSGCEIKVYDLVESKEKIDINKIIKYYERIYN